MPDHPRPSPAVVARNWKLVQIDSVFVGIVNAALPFVPIFVLRLGASATELGVMAGLGALSAFGLAIPVGRWLPGRRNIVPWYSRLRLLSWLAYPAMAIIAAALPPERAIPAILAITALAALASTAGQVAFPIVVD